MVVPVSRELLEDTPSGLIYGEWMRLLLLRWITASIFGEDWANVDELTRLEVGPRAAGWRDPDVYDDEEEDW